MRQSPGKNQVKFRQNDLFYAVQNEAQSVLLPQMIEEILRLPRAKTEQEKNMAKWHFFALYLDFFIVFLLDFFPWECWDNSSVWFMASMWHNCFDSSSSNDRVKVWLSLLYAVVITIHHRPSSFCCDIGLESQLHEQQALIFIKRWIAQVFIANFYRAANLMFVNTHVEDACFLGKTGLFLRVVIIYSDTQC